MIVDSKWAEAEAIQSIITHQTIFFINKNTFTRFGIPKLIITDHRTIHEFSSLKNFEENEKLIYGSA